jgi:glycerol uptake facilitator-like aquaporin
MTIKRELTVSEFSGYVLAQLAGAMLGVWLAHLMFNLSILEVSTKTRTGLGQWVAEVVATAGLLFVILRVPAAKVSVLVACYIGAAYWFTSSTSFANPAAVWGRMLSNTFAGIAPSDALAFVFAQFIGALLAYWVNAFVLVTPPSPSSPSNS